MYFIWIFLFLSLLQQYYGYMYFKPIKIQYLYIIDNFYYREDLLRREFCQEAQVVCFYP